MRNKMLLFALVILLVLTAVTPAFAGFTWCATDPNIKLPNGGVLHVMVAVPQEDLGTPVTLVVTAPSGSRVVGNTHGITVTLNDNGPAGQLTAEISAGCPIQIYARLRGQVLSPGVSEFDGGSGSVTWTW